MAPGTVKVHGGQWGEKGLAEAPSRPSVLSGSAVCPRDVTGRCVSERSVCPEADASGLRDHWTLCSPRPPSLFSPLFILESSGVGESKAYGESGEPCRAGPFDLTSLLILGLPLLPPNTIPLSYASSPQH